MLSEESSLKSLSQASQSLSGTNSKFSRPLHANLPGYGSFRNDISPSGNTNVEGYAIRGRSLKNVEDSEKKKTVP